MNPNVSAVDGMAAQFRNIFLRLASLERASGGGGGGGGNVPVVEGWWNYSNATTGPANVGEIRTSFPDGNPGTSGTVWLSQTDADGLDWSLLTPQVGQTLVIRDEDGDSWTMSVDAIPSPGEFTTTILTSTGTPPKKNTRIKVGLLGDLTGGGANGGFTHFGSTTPVANEVGETWFDTNTGHANVWDGFLWVPYAIYPGGDEVDGMIVFQRSSDVTLVDGTGAMQVGPNGGNNVGFDGNEIQSRIGGAGTSLHLNLDGGLVTLAESTAEVRAEIPGIEMPKTASTILFTSAGPNGLVQGSYSGDGGSFIYRTTPQAWFFENGAGGVVMTVADGLVTAYGQGNECLTVGGTENSATRPFLSFRDNTGNRVMYIGYPDPSTKEVRVYADQGPLQLLAGNSTDGVRSATIYNATANDWGVFIEANGRMGRTASTLRAKTNVEPLDAADAAAILADFDWVRFNYKDEDGNAKPDVSFGGIAEWLDEKRPELVGYDEEGLPSGIRYNSVWPVVARVVQSQQERIDKLEATVADLVARLDAK